MMKKHSCGRLTPISFLTGILFLTLLSSCGEAPTAVAPPKEASTVLKEEGVAQDVEYSKGQEIEISTSDNFRLKGNIYSPEGTTGILPGAIIIGAPDGSDTSSVHYLATQLSARGIVCLTFFPRGTGFSAGLKQANNYEWQKDDASAAVKHLLKDQRVDPLNFGFIGMDEGAELALFAAAGNNQRCFLISGSLPLIEASEKVTRGFNNNVKASLAVAQQEYRQGKIDFPALVKKQQELLVGQGEGYRIPMTADDTYWTWFDSWKNFDTKALLGKLHGPALFIYGTADNFKADDAEDIISDKTSGAQREAISVQSPTDGNLVDAYRNKQMTDKTLAVMASFMQAQGKK